MEYEYIEKLFQLAKKATLKKEVPVSALLVNKGKIIASTYNKRETKKDIFAHAEILAIKKASKKLKRWNLNDCEIYVSLKPCSMCAEVIKQSRISKVYYLLDKQSYKHEYNKSSYEKIGDVIQENRYQQLLNQFFRKMR